jgi:hypothetical protein
LIVAEAGIVNGIAISATVMVRLPMVAITTPVNVWDPLSAAMNA